MSFDAIKARACHRAIRYANGTRMVTHRFRHGNISAGFSLTEVLIAIGIIVVLVGLLSTVTLDPGAASQTNILLAALKGIAAEYEVETGTIIDHSTPAAPNDSIERFIEGARKRPTPAGLIPSLGKDQVQDTDGDGYDEVLDGWGRQIKYFSINVPEQPGYDETQPLRNRPYFASSGSDGEWGDVRDTATADLKAFSKDNHYSFNVE